MSVGDVPCLKSWHPFWSSLFCFCSTACIPACLLFCRLILSEVAVYIGGLCGEGAAAICRPNWKACHHQLVAQVQHFCHLCQKDLKTHWRLAVICQLWPFTNAVTRNQHPATLPSWWTTKLGKISELFKQCRPASSAPVWTWKWICAAQLSSLQPWGSQIQKWKLSLRVRSPRGFGSHWQPAQLCQFITGPCIPLQSKTNNHRVIIYLRSLPTTVEQRLPMCQ